MKEDPKKQYENHVRAAKVYLDNIRGLISSHNPKEVHWGHVGDMGHIVEQLQEIQKFLKN